MTTKELIKKHEGIKLYPYKDTAGKLTIGVGHNLSDDGISLHIAETLLTDDIKIAINGLREIFKDWDDIPSTAQMALTDMMFNLGYNRFNNFKKMIAAIKICNWKEAAKEAENSLWCKQLPTRCKYDANMLRTCNGTTK